MKKQDLIIYTTIFLILAGLFAYLPPFAIWSDVEAVKFVQMKNFHLHDTLEINYPGRGIGLNASNLKTDGLFMTERHGSLYVNLPPLFPYLSSLFYPLMGERVINFLPLLAFFLSVVIFDRMLHCIVPKPWIRYALLLTCFAASPVLFFALTFFEHVPALFMVILSLYFLVRYFRVSPKPANLLLSSFFLSLGGLFRTEILFLVAASFILQGWSFLKRGQYRAFVISSAGLVVPVAAYGILNIMTIGTISGLHIDFNNRIHDYPIRFVLLSIAVLGGLAAVAHLCKKEIRERVQRVRIRAFLALLFTLFIFSNFDQSPIALLFLQFPVILVLFLSSDDDATGSTPEDGAILREILLGMSFLFMALVAFFMGDMQPNVCFALPLFPLVVTVIGLDWEKIFTVRLIVAVFAALVLFSAKSLFTSIPKDLLSYKMYNAQRIDWLSEHTQTGDVIIFDNKPLMNHAGPLFFERVFVVENNPERLAVLLDLLKEKGLHRCFFQSSNTEQETVLRAFSPAVTTEMMPLPQDCASSCSAGLYLYRIPLNVD